MVKLFVLVFLITLAHPQLVDPNVSYQVNVPTTSHVSIRSALIRVDIKRVGIIVTVELGITVQSVHARILILEILSQDAILFHVRIFSILTKFLID